MDIPGREVVAEYLRLRSVARELNHRLVETLSRDDLDVGGKKLGILKGKTLVLDSEDEIAVLMDFCLYNVRRNGRNAIERFLLNSPPPPGSDEMRILQAMQNAWYSLFLLERTVAGTGVQVLDLLRQQSLFVVDVRMREMTHGGVLISRMVPFVNFTMTGGAALPVPDAATAEVIQQHAASLAGKMHIADLGKLTPEQETELAAMLIRTCLKHGAGSMIAYQEPAALGHSRPSPSPRSLAGAPERVGRNDPCPCGSGKKFKKCCGARR
jgi:SEC-C motif